MLHSTRSVPVPDTEPPVHYYLLLFDGLRIMHNCTISRQIIYCKPTVPPSANTNKMNTPRFDARQLKLELDALTEEEIEECSRDVHGKNGNEEDGENNNEDEQSEASSSSSIQRPPTTTGLIQETPTFLREAIEDLHQLLLALEQNQLTQFEEGTPLEMEAYQLALFTCPGYVNSDGFRLMFLRAMQFDIPMTAKRIVQYWSRKVELFGPDRAFRRLTVQDLLEDQDDRSVLEQVPMYGLPQLDHAGRGIILNSRAKWPSFLVRGRGLSLLRVFWYAAHQVLENEEVQKNGCIGIGVNDDTARSFSSYDAKMSRWICKDIINILPIRILAYHQFANNDVMKDVVQYIMFGMNPHMRARMRAHAITSPFEVGPILEGFGIPMDAIPIEFGGDDDFDPEAWLEERIRADSNHIDNVADGVDTV